MRNLYEEECTEENYTDYCITNLTPKDKPLFVQFANSSGEDKTFDHSFVMFSEGDKVYRAECYFKWVETLG